MDSTATTARWRHLDHDADMGIEGIGASPAIAFEQAALAMMALITDQTIGRSLRLRLRCRAPDLELLLVDWLNTLIYEMAVRSVLFGAFAVTIEGDELRAEVWGEPVDPPRHQPVVEVKGATLTGLAVHRDDAGLWHARCVVDV